jgi:hypothetical protein
MCGSPALDSGERHNDLRRKNGNARLKPTCFVRESVRACGFSRQTYLYSQLCPSLGTCDCGQEKKKIEEALAKLLKTEEEKVSIRPAPNRAPSVPLRTQPALSQCIVMRCGSVRSWRGD